MVALHKKLIIVLSLAATSNAFAATIDNCRCYKNKIKFNQCQTASSQSLTWWDWLTSNKSTQLHFYQLIELLHSTETKFNDSTVAANQKRIKKDKL